jgi:integrase
MKKRADGRYRKTIDGKTFYGDSEREVYRKILDYTDKKARGMSFAEVADQWWDIEVVQLYPSTVQGYKRATGRAKEFFKDYLITDITAAEITKYLHHLARQGFSKKTVKNNKIVVSRIMHFATVECYIKSNPARDAELPRNLKEKKRKAATQMDEQAIRNAFDDEWALPYFALMTGLRKGEIVGLQWGDIDLDKGLINVNRSVWYGNGGSHVKSTKTEAGERYIPIVNDLRKKIEIMAASPHDPKHYVFGEGTTPLSEKAYRHRFKKYSERVGITSTLQQLRKSFATAAVDANIPPDVLREIIGHKDISTTLNIYAEVREHRIKDAGKSLSELFSSKK